MVADGEFRVVIAIFKMMQRPSCPWILIVDDDRVSVMACQRTLKKLKVEGNISVASDGQQALDDLRNRMEDYGGALPPTVLFLDLNMPRMGGMELVDHIRCDPGMDNLKIFAFVSPEPGHRQRAELRDKVAGFVCKDRALETFSAALDIVVPRN